MIHYPALMKASVRLYFEHRIISVIAETESLCFESLKINCFFLQAFCSLSAVRRSDEYPSGIGSLSPIILTYGKYKNYKNSIEQTLFNTYFIESNT